jgi:uncharacterized membrane protein YedE/YeeE
MHEAELSGLTAQVLWAVFFMAVAFGAVAQRTQFCTMGAVADIFSMGDWSRMRMWVLAIGVAMIGFNAMVALGWVRADDSIYGGTRILWLSNAVGGAMFGFGMVLASGCGSKTLVRIGGGSLKALVVFIVLGIAAYATLRGIFGVWRVATLDTVAIELPVAQDLPTLLAHAGGFSVRAAAVWTGCGIGLALAAWALSRPEGRTAEVLLAGVVIGGVITGVWWVSGVLGHLAEHPLTLEETFVATNSRRMESLSFVAPMAYTLDWLMLYSDRSKVLTMAIVSVLGVIAGSGIVAIATRRFRWEGFADTSDTALHLVGAVLMGVGGVAALGCTVGQGLSGISTLSLGSAIAVGGIVGGAVLGLKYQTWRLERIS